MAEPRIGLTRTELERHVRWLLRRPPDDPAKLAGFLTDLVVDVVDANNAAIAARLAADGDTRDGEAF
ncbi:hypothetical protein [uncultured Cellulomonas sp.]|uniref:hypothetical protein n=1 Tax=uncultured Cellulomonas sp. TaxID=189682 RepID=UPI0026389005|nr:hypothetical protein [uncultured Cellulomonas sp.]